MKYRALILGCMGSLILLSAGIAAPQTNHWRTFTKEDGLPENSCVSVTVGASGNILSRHAKSAAISVFDGYNFTTVPAPGTNRGRIYESPGGQLWTVTHEGVLEFREGEWWPHLVPQIAAHFRASRTNEVLLQPVRQGRVVIFLPDETLQLDATDPEHSQIETLSHTNRAASHAAVLSPPEQFSVRRVFDVQADGNSASWLATSDGLFRQTRELWKSEQQPDRKSVV